MGQARTKQNLQATLAALRTLPYSVPQPDNLLQFSKILPSALAPATPSPKPVRIPPYMSTQSST